MWYAFKNRRNGKLIRGTDFRRSPPRQILADENLPPKLFNGYELLSEMRRRNINTKTYDVICVEVKEREENETDH